MISKKNKLGPYHMHVKLVIMIYSFKWSSEVTHRVGTEKKKEKSAFLPALFLCKNFCYLGVLGCVLMNPD